MSICPTCTAEQARGVTRAASMETGGRGWEGGGKGERGTKVQAGRGEGTDAAVRCGRGQRGQQHPEPAKGRSVWPFLLSRVPFSPRNLEQQIVRSSKQMESFDPAGSAAAPAISASLDPRSHAYQAYSAELKRGMVVSFVNRFEGRTFARMTPGPSP
eukprot:687009-Rhodomonas_salina.1